MLLNVLRQLLGRAQRRGGSVPTGRPHAADSGVALEIGQLLTAKEYGRALKTARRALADAPFNPLLHYQAGLALFLLGDAEGACFELQRVLELDPRSFESRVLLGTVLQHRKLMSAALASYLDAAALRPNDAAVQGYVGNVQFGLGRHADAIDSYERALSLDPANAAVHSNLLLAMNSLPGLARDALFEAHRRWARQHERFALPTGQLQPVDPDPERALRIGYVSADFREHSVAYFIEPVWSRIDRRTYATCVYDNFPGEPDSTSRRLQGHAELWRRVASYSDDELEGLVREDRIDILVDLSGHTGGNRLPVFARRAAPVQVSWFAYMNTTGLASMDYRITDAWFAPPGDERYYTETLFRIPCCACFTPARESPPVNDLPALGNGFITFASFNNWTKVSAEVISAWARLLASMPRSRLLAVVQGGDDPNVRTGIEQQFAARAIEKGRLEVCATRPLSEFLRLFHQVDVALDSFPYTGGTTSLHTLWMGVPVVTLQSIGETGRCSASYLRGLGLEDLVADSVEDYCNIAQRLASEPARLQRIRATLRESMSRSPMLQADETTRAVERAFREMWRARVRGTVCR